MMGMSKILAVALLVSLGAVTAASGAPALGAASPWAEIRSTPDIIPEAPMIFFGADAVSVLDVCVRGDALRADTGGEGMVEIPAGATSQSYNIRVDRLVIADAEHTYNQYLFTKHFDIPRCGEQGTAARAESPAGS